MDCSRPLDSNRAHSPRRALVTRFYMELEGGASRAMALKQAQLELLESTKFRHPVYWSPFLLISSWL